MNIQTSAKLIYASTELKEDKESENFRRMVSQGIVYETFLPFARAGQAPNAWGLTADTCASLPNIHRAFSWDWAEVTDRRAMDVAAATAQDDLPIYVFWSGGIDSTVILAALLRNWSREQLDRVIVVMNNASYYENSWFFNRCVRNTLRYQEAIQQDWTTSWLINGYPGDTIWVQADILEIDRWRPGTYQQKLATSADHLLTWLSWKSDAAYARWLLEMIMANSASVGIELQDCEDFYWWLNFNFIFAGELYKAFQYKRTCHSDRADLACYYERSIAWFSSHDYQLWSVQNRSNGVKYQGNPRSYKMPAKKYIFAVDKNAWYRDYKTKMSSSRIVYPNTVLAIWDDGKASIQPNFAKS